MKIKLHHRKIDKTEHEISFLDYIVNGECESGEQISYDEIRRYVGNVSCSSKW